MNFIRTENGDYIAAEKIEKLYIDYDSKWSRQCVYADIGSDYYTLFSAECDNALDVSQNVYTLAHDICQKWLDGFVAGLNRKDGA